MVSVGSAFQQLESWFESYSMELFADVLKPEWIEQSLEACGRQSKRHRKLTAPFTVWLVTAMGFLRNLSICNILSQMGTVFGVGSLWHEGQPPTSASAVEARDRLGFGPLRILFERLRTWLLETHRELRNWKGMLLLALDGTTFKVPDSDENRRRFGLPGSKRGRAAFPQMRALFLVSTKLRFILGALFAPYGRGEITLALRMLKAIPQGALVIPDRGFAAWQFLLGLKDFGSQFLVRAKKGMVGRVLQLLGPGDRLVEMRIPRALRRRFPTLPKTVVVREITVRIQGQPFRFFTSLLDSSAYSAMEPVRLHAERWQEETAPDEVKTHQCGATTVNRPVIFRCQTSRRVLHEAYGLALAYNSFRTLMAQSAQKHQAEPLRLSFVDSLERLREAALLMAAAPTYRLATIFDDLLHSIAQCRVPRRRRENPRVVCVKMSAYNLRKKAS